MEEIIALSGSLEAEGGVRPEVVVGVWSGSAI